MQCYVYNINKADISIDKTELAQRLKTPTGYTDEEVEGCIAGVIESCNPKGCYVKVPLAFFEEGRADLGFTSLCSRDLCKTLQGCKECYVMAATLGIDTDRFVNKTSLVSKARGFIADAVASALAEAVMDILNNHLKQSASLTPRFSPGYGDLDLSCQGDILNALSADKLIGIKLGANHIMTPRKSITAICGIKE